MEKLAGELLGIELSTSAGPIKGVSIDVIKPGMVAQRSGLRIGDLIQACQSEPICSHDDLTQIIKTWIAKGQFHALDSPTYMTMHLSILRSGMLIDKEVHFQKNIVRTPRSPASRDSGSTSPRNEDGSKQQPRRRRKMSGYSHENNNKKRDAPYLGFTINVIVGPPSGLLVVRAEDGQPAKEGGILEGDLIVKINDEPVELGSSLTSVYRQMHPGDEVIFTVLRAAGTSKEQELRCVVTIGRQQLSRKELDFIVSKLLYESQVALAMQSEAVVEQPHQVKARRASLLRADAATSGELGMNDYELLLEATKMKLYCGLGMETSSGNIKGVLITRGNDKPGGGGGVGLQTGDLIQACNNVPTSNILHLSAEWCQAKRKGLKKVTFTVLRSGRFLIDKTIRLQTDPPTT